MNFKNIDEDVSICTNPKLEVYPPYRIESIEPMCDKYVEEVHEDSLKKEDKIDTFSNEPVSKEYKGMCSNTILLISLCVLFAFYLN